jgi:hypothetical protein
VSGQRWHIHSVGSAVNDVFSEDVLKRRLPCGSTVVYEKRRVYPWVAKFDVRLAIDVKDIYVLSAERMSRVKGPIVHCIHVAAVDSETDTVYASVQDEVHYNITHSIAWGSGRPAARATALIFANSAVCFPCWSQVGLHPG